MFKRTTNSHFGDSHVDLFEEAVATCSPRLPIFVFCVDLTSAAASLFEKNLISFSLCQEIVLDWVLEKPIFYSEDLLEKSWSFFIKDLKQRRRERERRRLRKITFLIRFLLICAGH